MHFNCIVGIMPELANRQTAKSDAVIQNIQRPR